MAPAFGSAQELAGLGTNELQIVLDELDHSEPDTRVRTRDRNRLQFRLNGIAADITQPGGGTRSVQIATRNISQHGMAFLHSSYLHAGTVCVIHLPRTIGDAKRVPAVVSGFRHVTRHVHEVDLTFKEPIDVREHVEINVLSQSFGRDRVDQATLTGRLLMVCECRFQSAGLRSMLTDTRLEVVIAQDLPTTEAAMSSGPFDLVLCDLEFCGQSAGDMARKLRSSGQACPILVMSADTSSIARERVRSSGADGFLLLPAVPEALLGTIAEYLSHRRDRSQAGHDVHSTLAADSPLRADADQFVAALCEVRCQLQAAANKNEAEVLRGIALRLVASAGPLGFEPIAVAASALVRTLAATMSVHESARELATLIAVCASAKRGVSPTAAAGNQHDHAAH